MPDQPDPALDPSLRWLRRLVTTLTVVMIAGMIAVVTLMILKLGATPAPPLPDSIALPDGAKARSVTYGPGWYLVVTDQDRILVFDSQTGKLRQSVPLDP